MAGLTAYDRLVAAWPDRNSLWNAHSASQHLQIPLRSTRRALRRMVAAGLIRKYGTGRSAAGQLYQRATYGDVAEPGIALPR